ncbi:MAG: hypothetical protein MJE77_15355 [Proteobacteria bacterium]|nr:hypothetical protein [Pseudomonadota bacterium]
MKPRATFEKRRKEQLRKQRKQDKAERRKLRKEERVARPAVDDNEDPDIAHIVWGPQPLADE